MIRATMRQSAQSRDSVIRLPPEDEDKILAAMDALGGCTAWGAQTSPRGPTLIDPGGLVERLFPEVLALLNAVMEHTPGASSQSGPLSGASRWYSERNRLSIRWQLGL
jgi:hypothetical protein